MKQTFLTLIGLLFLTVMSYAQQEPIDVTDQTIKIGGLKEEELYFGFAAGDKIVFNFNQVDNKELKEIEIVEYPNNSKFSDYKTKQVENKNITVTKQGVYIFRFKNSALVGRICKIKIQRIPASDETKNFNSTVTWETKQETTYNTYTKDVIVGYDTAYTQKTKKVLVKTEQKEELIFDKPQRVHSTSNSNGNKTTLFFTLPQNQVTPYKTTKVISWAYWVGVGEEANQAWKQNSQTISNVAKGAAAYFATPLGALAVGAVTDLMIPKAGEDVYYAIADQTNKDLFLSGYQYKIYDQGKGVAGFRKFTDAGLCQGTYYVLLSNDNIMQGIDASVKVIAIVETTTYEDQQYTDINVTPRYEKKTFSDPIVKTFKVPVTGQ
jgi:hypothetical protein